MSLSIFNGFNFGKVQTQNAAGGGGAVGGWKELGRTTLGSAVSSITVSSLPNKRYYKVLTSILGESSNSDIGIQFNSDTGANYSMRGAYDGTNFSIVNNSESVWYSTDTGGTSPIFTVGYIANKSDKEKLFISHGVRQMAAGAGTATERSENVGKWANTSNAISSITVKTGGAQTFNSGSEVVVLGYDPADTHTTNFWEELASVDGDGVTGNLTATFTSKKYLWIQALLNTSATATLRTRLGNGSIDTGANYANRYSTNGGGETTSVNDTTFIDDPWIDGATKTFYNIFIINNASNEKLLIGHRIDNPTAGAGSIGNRLEFVGKWTNTTNQADRFQFSLSAGVMNTSATMKVWGSN